MNRWTVQLCGDEFLLQFAGRTVGVYSSYAWCQAVCDAKNATDRAAAELAHRDHVIQEASA